MSLLSSSSGHSKTQISYELPELKQNIIGPVGDEQVQKIPMIDSRGRSNFALFCLINSNVMIDKPILPPTGLEQDIDQLAELMERLYNGKAYEAPTHQSFENVKEADYKRIRDPNRYSHILWVRHVKMKKHQRIKWRKKNLARIKRIRLDKNIRKEKVFRAEMLAQIKEAEDFKPEEYVHNILHTIDNVPKTETTYEKIGRYLDLIRKNRTQTNLLKPKPEE